MLNKRILRLKGVLERTGDSRSGLYLKISKNLFPRPIKLSTRQSGWLENEVDEWIEQRVQQSRRERP